MGKRKPTAGKKKAPKKVEDELADLQRKAADAQRKRERRAAETDEQRQQRRMKEAERIAISRSSKSTNDLRLEQNKNTQRRADARRRNSLEQKQLERDLDTQQQRADARKRLSSEEKQRSRDLNTSERAEARKQMSSEEKRLIRDLNTSERAETRKQMSSEEKRLIQDLDTSERAEARKRLSSEEQQLNRDLNTSERAEARKQMSSEEKRLIQDLDTSERAEARKRLSSEEQQLNRDLNTSERAEARKQMSSEEKRLNRDLDTLWREEAREGMSSEEKRLIRDLDTSQRAEARKRLSSEEQQLNRDLNTSERAEARKQMSSEEKRLIQDLDTSERAEARKRLSSEEQQLNRDLNTSERAEARKQMSSEEKRLNRDLDTLWREEAREGMSSEEKRLIRDLDTSQRAEARKRLSSEEQQLNRDLNTSERAEARKQMSSEEKRLIQDLDTSERAEARKRLSSEEKQRSRDLNTSERAEARKQMSSEEKRLNRDLDTLWREEAREGMSSEEKRLIRDLDTSERAEARKRMSSEEKRLIQDLDTSERAEARKRLSSEEQQLNRDLNTSERAEARKQMSSEEKRLNRDLDTLWREEAREGMSSEEKRLIRDLDTSQRAEARKRLSSEEQQLNRDLNTSERAEARKQMSSEEKRLIQDLDTSERAEARKRLSSEEQQLNRDLNTSERAEARKQMSSEEKRLNRDLDTLWREEAREGMSSEEKRLIRDLDTSQRAEARKRLSSEEKQLNRDLDTLWRAEAREGMSSEERQRILDKDTERKALSRENEPEEDQDLRHLKDRTRKRLDKFESKKGQLYRQAIEDLMEEHPSLKEQRELYQYICFRKRTEGESIGENFAKIKELKKEFFRKRTDETPTEAVRRSEFCKLLDQYWLQRTEFAPKDGEEGLELEQAGQDEDKEKATRKIRDIASRLKGWLSMEEGNYWNRKDIRRIRRRFAEPPVLEPSRKQKKEEEERMEEMFELAISVSHVSCVNCQEFKRLAAGGYAKGSQVQTFTDKCLAAYENLIDTIDPEKYKDEERRKDAELRKRWMRIAVDELRKEKIDHEEAVDDDSAQGRLHICHYCNTKLREANPPPISFYNAMRPDKVPPELEAINDLGETLIALQTPFLKLLSLPAGGQHALEGRVTNVPNDWNTVKSALRIPRNWDEGTLVGVAMKRRTEYKSDYLAMYIDPETLWKAAVWLSKNNPEYAGLNLNKNWASEFHSQQPELADAMILRPEEQPQQTPEKRKRNVVEINITTPSPTKPAERWPLPLSGPRNQTARLSRSLSRMSITPKKSPQTGNREMYSPMLIDASPASLKSVTMVSPTTPNEAMRSTGSTSTPPKPRSSSWSSQGSRQRNAHSESGDAAYGEEVEEDNLLFPIRGLELPPASVVQERRKRGAGSPQDGRGEESKLPSRVVVAPAEKNSPLPFFTNCKAEEHSFPTIFTQGRFGFSWNRELPISFVQYARNRLKHSSNRFSTHRSYLFWAAYAYEVRRLESSISTQMRKASAKGKSGGSRINAGTLLDQESMDNFTANAGAFQVLSPMRGSPQYWNSATQDLVSMIRQLGPCTFFLTLSANDRNWKDVLAILLRMEFKREPSQKEVANISNRDRDDLVRKYKVQVVQQFYHRIQMMRSTILKSHLKPLGEIVDYWERYEMQARGSIHLHCLLWIKDAPTFGVDSDETICKFVDKYITTDVPDPDEDQALHHWVTTLLQHGHRPSCQRRKLKPEHRAAINNIKKDDKLSEKEKTYAIKKVTEDAQCRFSYPKPVTDKTYLEYEKISFDGEKVDPLRILPIREAEWAEEAKKAGLDEDQVQARVAAKRKSFLQSLKVNVVYKRSDDAKWTNVHNTAVLRC